MSGEEMKEQQSQAPPDERWREGRRATRGHDEKEEKDEKDREKTEKEEKYARDPLSGIIWALIFIAAGLILLTQSMGFLRLVRLEHAWQLVLVAVGLILLLEVVLRLLIPAYRRPVLGTLIFAFFLLAMGLGGLYRWATMWPIFLILIGLAILLGGLFRGRL